MFRVENVTFMLCVPRGSCCFCMLKTNILWYCQQSETYQEGTPAFQVRLIYTVHDILHLELVLGVFKMFNLEEAILSFMIFHQAVHLFPDCKVIVYGLLNSPVYALFA